MHYIPNPLNFVPANNCSPKVYYSSEESIHLFLYSFCDHSVGLSAHRGSGTHADREDGAPLSSEL